VLTDLRELLELQGLTDLLELLVLTDLQGPEGLLELLVLTDLRELLVLTDLQGPEGLLELRVLTDLQEQVDHQELLSLLVELLTISPITPHQAYSLLQALYTSLQKT
jgi:hypothetical protein